MDVLGNLIRLNRESISILFVTLVILFLSTYSWFRRRLSLVKQINEIPGPKGLPLIGNVLIFLGSRERRIQRIRDVLLGYAREGIFKFWLGPFPTVVLCKAETCEELLSGQKFLKKGSMYRFMDTWIGQGLITASGDKWHSSRRMLTPAFHFRILEDFLPIMNEQSLILVNKLESQIGKAPFNIYPYITLCALDIICASAMGCDINAQGNEESEYVKAVYGASTLIYQRAIRFWNYSNFIYYKTWSGKRFKKVLDTIQGFTNKVIQDKKRLYKEMSTLKNDNVSDENSNLGIKRRLAFLDLLLEYSQDGKLLTDKNLQEEVDTFMFAGHDTTSSSIFWNLYTLGLNPDVQDKVYNEIIDVIGKEERPITSEDIKNLRYLDCVFKETIRLYPPVPFVQRRIEEDFKVGKYTIPAGTDCTIAVIYIHLDPDYFPDPYKFNPDRFLPENSVKRHPYAYIPFSAGPRNCIGQKYAQMEDKVVVTYILRRFKVTVVDNLDFYPGISELVLRPNERLKVKLERR